MRTWNKKYVIFGWGALTIILAYYFTFFNMDGASFTQPYQAVEQYLNGALSDAPNVGMNKIIFLLRIPRVLLGLLAGIGLALSGTMMQSVTRNYLVSPFTIGISSAAAFGAAMCIVFGRGEFLESDFGIIACAFFCALLCGFIVYFLSRRIAVHPNIIILVGISLNYLFGAMTATVEFFAQDHKLAAVVQWLFGSLDRASWDSVFIVAVVIVVGYLGSMYLNLSLDAIAVNDDETSGSLGVNSERTRILAGIMASLMTATIISFTGVIGFVGLVAPHIARLIIGNRQCYLLTLSAILGAFLLIVADVIGKFIYYPVNIPVGIVISFLGVPIFIHLLFSKTRR